MSKTVVIYHGNCNDGFGAAYSAWKFFGDKAEYIPVEHALEKGFPFDKIDVVGKDVFILDFAYDRNSMQELMKKAKHVQLIDHHESAKNELAGLSCCHFDMNQSGAMLAWKAFHPKKPVPYLMELLQDRDLWTKIYKESDDFFNASNFFPKTFEYWDKLSNTESVEYKKALEIGRILTENQTKQVLEIAEKNVQKIIISGIEGYIVNASHQMTSELGSYLSSQSKTFAVLWYENANGLISCSLRSDKNFNSLPLTQFLGGGGHKQASGCKISTYAEFKDKLKKAENMNLTGFGVESIKKQIKI